MSEQLRQRFFSPDEAFHDPITFWVVGVIVAVLAFTWAGIVVLHRTGRITDQSYADVMVSWRSWLILAVILLAPGPHDNRGCRAAGARPA